MWIEVLVGSSLSSWQPATIARWLDDGVAKRGVETLFVMLHSLAIRRHPPAMAFSGMGNCRIVTPRQIGAEQVMAGKSHRKVALRMAYRAYEVGRVQQALYLLQALLQPLSNVTLHQVPLSQSNLCADKLLSAMAAVVSLHS